MSINETVLEMHFHKELLNSIQNTYGLGNRGLEFYKYSTRAERFVGFDQAFAKIESDDQGFKSLIEDVISGNNTHQFLCYFIQYKVVSIMNTRKRNSQPTNEIRSRYPLYRIKLSTNRKKGLPSQHECLYAINQNMNNSFVYYAMPLVFNKDQLYESPNLDELKLIQFDDNTPLYNDNNQHYITLPRDDTNDARWFSEPITAKAISASKLSETVQTNLIDKSGLKIIQNILNNEFNEVFKGTHFEKNYHLESMPSDHSNLLKELLLKNLTMVYLK